MSRLFQSVSRLHGPTILALVALVFLAFTDRNGSASADEVDNSITTTHEKDLHVDDSDSVGVFKWSPDSKKIAFSYFVSGRVGIIDVDTGHILVIPSVTMGLVADLSWSPNGEDLAIDTAKDLKIVHINTLAVTHAISATSVGDGKWRFGKMHFALDGLSLFVASPRIIHVARDTNYGLLYKFDLSSSALSVFIDSPFGEKNASPDSTSARFQVRDGHLIFTTRVDRLFDRVTTTHKVGNIDYGVGTNPSTCFIFDLGIGLAVEKTQSVDFPEIHTDNLDVSKDIFDCRYSSAFQRLIVTRYTAIDPNAAIGWHGKVYFESYDIDRGSALRVFGQLSHSEDGIYGDHEIHPHLPMFLAVAYNGSGETIVDIWDLLTGSPLGHLVVSQYLWRPQFSPDGGRVAFQTKSALLALYDISNKGAK